MLIDRRLGVYKHSTDSQNSSAEIVYGEPQRLPIDLIVPSANKVRSVNSYAEDLKFTTRATRRNSKTSEIYLPPNLLTSEYVFIRDDRRGKPSS